MIRVMYRWTVEPDQQAEFKATWRNTTRAIHRDVAGALGSMCLRSIDRPDEMITIATWQTEQQWRAFIEDAKHQSMKGLHALGSLISAEPYAEVGDETVSADQQRPRGRAGENEGDLE